MKSPAHTCFIRFVRLLPPAQASALLLGSTLFLATPVHADSIALHPVADTTLFESAPNDNMGGWTHIAAGSTGSQGERTRNRGLVRFDPASALPAGAQITSVSLQLTVVLVPGQAGGGSAVNSTFALHRLLQSWGEGDKLGDRGFPADPGEATWNFRFFNDQSWSEPGGAPGSDFAAAPSATRAIAGKATYLFGPSTALRDDVQSWLDAPASNFGWLLLTQSEERAKTARGFASREDPDVPPVLLIEFTASPPLRLEQVAARTNQFTFSFATQADHAYTVEFTGGLASASWTALTHITPGPAKNVVVTDPILPAPRYYRVRQD